MHGDNFDASADFSAEFKQSCMPNCNLGCYGSPTLVTSIWYKHKVIRGQGVYNKEKVEVFFMPTQLTATYQWLHPSIAGIPQNYLTSFSAHTAQNN